MPFLKRNMPKRVTFRQFLISSIGDQLFLNERNQKAFFSVITKVCKTTVVAESADSGEFPTRRIKILNIVAISKEIQNFKRKGRVAIRTKTLGVIKGVNLRRFADFIQLDTISPPEEQGQAEIFFTTTIPLREIISIKKCTAQ
ncbi:hypothetical protein J14TS5_58600 [Paenibacillus lautus]|uniref:hypothetical protein n=1 Tax=Paenibacillus lautus TaxID=1401 RepID=UPI001B0E4C0B|nr:hypothetical protein [Paenibacillus lautus]GIP00775.1 hypothetical protein J14TS5_58600 [Paenibacillus lautus]